MKSLWHILIVSLAIGLLPLIGCGDDDSDPPVSTDSDTETPAGTETTPVGSDTTPVGSDTTPVGSDTTPVGSDTTPDGTDTTPDGTDTTPTGPSGLRCNDAFALTMNQPDTDATLYSLSKADGFQYHLLKGAKANSFLVFYAVANPSDNPALMDTVISIYSADGKTLLATSDDATPRITSDSEIIYRVPADMDICVRIEEWAGWTSTSSTKKNLKYKLLVGQSNDTNADKEPNNTGAAAQALTLAAGTTSSSINFETGIVLGTIEGADVADHYSYAIDTDMLTTNLYVMPSGVGDAAKNASGHGSTLEAGPVSIANSAGDIVAEIDTRNGISTLTMPFAEPTASQILIGRVAGVAAGANDFYVFKFERYDASGFSAEAEVTGSKSNDTSTHAEALLAETNGLFYAMGHIDAEDDIDYFSFTAAKDDTVVLSCSALRSGSGLVGATFTIENSTGTELQSETETATKDIYWDVIPQQPDFASMDYVTIPADGTYYLKVETTSQSTRVLGNSYTCVVGPKPPA